MNDKDLKLNKDAAEALAWEFHKVPSKYLNKSYYAIPKELHDKFKLLFVAVEDMHFHDSYDWVMLLVHHLANNYRGDKVLEDVLRKKNEYHDAEWWDATPLQITQACLEVWCE